MEQRTKNGTLLSKNDTTAQICNKMNLKMCVRQREYGTKYIRKCASYYNYRATLDVFKAQKCKFGKQVRHAEG